ncbi:MAG TPA: isoaspartyl peptidase/L-asparaginase family protein [Candidatus Dormibacteraeota bacterium]
MARAALVVHGGAGAPNAEEYEERQAAVECALEAGWPRLRESALEAVLAAVRQMEDEPILNAGIGACLNSEGEIELDAGLMEGSELRAGAVGAVRDVRHPVDLARAIMADGRHVLLVADGASRFAREAGVETCDPLTFMTERQQRNFRREGVDTVGAVAVDEQGHTAVAVSTGGYTFKLPGRVGDSPLPGAGFYADDRAGAACGTGHGEGFMRLVLCHLAVIELQHGMGAQEVADGAVGFLGRKVQGQGGLILVTKDGEVAAAYNTPFMAWASRTS